ncbi:MAG: diguanylate cyclase domain-containing protein [Nitrincola lacisaponensis]|uniref:sensor domain-containing diguanylate cyclase n=1 Tax=Nitrincola lacisaponensis TaxID=267850 RepID=UPI00391C1E39
MKTEEILYRLDDIMSDSADLESLIRPLLQLIEEFTGLESVYFTSIDFHQNIQSVVFARNMGDMQITEGLSVPWEDTLCKRSFEESRTYVNQVSEHWGDSEAAQTLGIETYISEPVRRLDHEIFGTLCGASASRREVDDQSILFLRLFAQIISQQLAREELITQLRQLNAEYSRLAMLDSLTGVPNRRALIDELKRMLARAQREGSAVHVGFIDLDNFKQINDVYGHDAGDLFLIQMAEQLKTGLRGSDVLARYGGDEFVALSMANSAGDSAAQAGFAERLSQLTQGMFELGAVTLEYAGASVGVVTSAHDEFHPEALIARADAAMYAVKQQRRLVE